jgi:hypothetical protein
LYIQSQIREEIKGGKMSLNKNRGCFSVFFPKSSPKDTTVTEYPADKEEELTLPYRVSDRFLSQTEYSFYMVAKKVLADRFIICPQIPLSSIFFITDKANYTAAFNKISRKRIDFLICDGLTVKPLFGIELDDKSHEKLDRIERDIFVEKIFENSGLPLLRIPVKNAYVTTDLELLFIGVLKSLNWHPSQPGMTTISASPHNSVETTENPTKCPKCGGDMVLRIAKSGPRQGEKFFGCKNYPNCRTIVPFVENQQSKIT